jgi:solute carrier family 34 (sodium-dependent phosphate cotransporter)
MVNFGKNYKDDIVNEWEQYYFDYNKLKKITNRTELSNSENINNNIKIHDDEVILELQKVDKFYNEKVNKILEDINSEYVHSNIPKIKQIFEDSDKLRHFILLNTISAVKLIKRRNKRIPNTASVLDFISEKDFYKCIKLNNIYKKLSEILKKKKIKYASEIIDESSMKLSLSILKKVRDINSFDDYNFLPMYNSNLKSDSILIDYLKNKLGPQNSMVIVEVDDTASLNDINNNNLSKSQKITYITSIPILLYTFLFGLDLMSGSFKVLSGKGMSLLFSSIQNPVAGVMIGIIATVLLQSSSTSTSIVVAMTGSNIIDVPTAIPIIMGANIGTSVTNTLVSHAHIRNVNEFRLAFAGATVHDMFNYLSVLVLLPIEVISGAFTYPLLYKISEGITNNIVGAQAVKFDSPIKVILSPFTKLFLSVDKNVIKGIANGCLNCTNTNSTSTINCWDLKMKNCLTEDSWNQRYKDGSIIKSGFLKDLGDKGGGVLGLIISLVVLCIALYLIVKVLHKLVLSSNGRGKIMRMVQKSLSISPYLTMIVGVLLTISVQSSSIITSTFTPLVGLSILTVEQMFPLTLGANIGTTCTAILASLVTESVSAIQIAICHFIFNIIGIVLWFPLKFTRKVPLKMAFRLGDLVAKYKWFGVYYILYLFLLIPIASWSISNLISINVIGLVFGILILSILGIISLYMFYKFERIVEFMLKCKRFNFNKRQIDEKQIEMH